MLRAFYCHEVERSGCEFARDREALFADDAYRLRYGFLLRMSTDDETTLDEPRFAYMQTKSGLVQIFYLGRIVTTLKGREAAKFLAKVETLGAREEQLLMAKATGHFKHGNEHPTSEF